ncbi:MAG: thymidine kinase [Eubacteriales bacterium]|nr:thymidine kinase [Eubacteriales bacterium]
MAKLYFKYGAMGSSKSAQVLITKFNYEERDMKVWLIKPAVDLRDGSDVIKSRIGLINTAERVLPETNLLKRFAEFAPQAFDVIITDECQFFSEVQIDQLRQIVDDYSIPVLCFGLRTDFLAHLFPGSKRLFELADSISEIKTICSCGSKATINARFDENGRIITTGDQVYLGGNDCYVALCHRCWQKRIRAEKAKQKPI